jgi:DNA-binding NarL/FixJ family response regulator
MRVLFATPDNHSISLLNEILESALCLTPIEVSVQEVRTKSHLMSRVDDYLDDIILLDWELVGSETSNLVKTMLTLNPDLRIVVLLPTHHRQYRQQVWAAGACNGIPKEYMDQEWLSTVLCIMNRAMQREARLLAKFAESRA